MANFSDFVPVKVTPTPANNPAFDDRQFSYVPVTQLAPTWSTSFAQITGPIERVKVFFRLLPIVNNQNIPFYPITVRLMRGACAMKI